MFLIRVDDYPFALVNDPRVDWSKRFDNLKWFDGVMKANGCKYILGVVPAHIMSEDIALFKQLNINIALHGYDHHHIKTYQAEFGYKFIDKTALLFKIGMEKLSGIKVNSYICPFNEYDDEYLVDIVRKLGIKDIFGGEAQDDEPIIKKIAFSPEDIVRVFSFDKRLYGASQDIIKNGLIEDGEIHCLVLHWTWEVNLNRQGEGKLNELCLRLKGRTILQEEV